MTLNNIVILNGKLSNFANTGNWHRLVSIMRLQLNTSRGKFLLVLKYGFTTDGLSVPKAFQHFLPAWDDNNVMYTLAGVVHDCLYGNKGFSTFSREECDDIFRGILRESGISRFKAGIADKCVEIFARRHFKMDERAKAELKVL